MSPPSPSTSTVGAAGGSDDTVVSVSDQPCSMPVCPPPSSITTRAQGPSADSPTSAESAPSGCIEPTATLSAYVKFRTLGALGVPLAWSSKVTPAKTSSNCWPLSVVRVTVRPEGAMRKMSS